MKILLDGDSCDVLKRTEAIAKANRIPCHWYGTLTRGARPREGYSVWHLVDPGPDAVDFAIVNACFSGDVVVTKDGGLAAMAMTRRAWVIHPHGGEYTEHNIGQTLAARYIRQRHRKGKTPKAVNGSPACNRARYEDVLLEVIRRGCPLKQK